MNNNEIFLNSKFSLSDKIWLKPKKDTQELATKFQQVYQISYPLAIFLAQKGLEIDQIETFLNPKIKFSMPVKVIYGDALGRKDKEGNSYLSYFFEPI